MKTRALIIEDNERNLLLEKDLLESSGFEVFTAIDAKSGILIAGKEIPDIILMDMRLPDMRGTDAAEILRADDATRGIPIVFVTTSIVGDERQLIADFVNSGYISKPINTRTFAEEIKKFIK